MRLRGEHGNEAGMKAWERNCMGGEPGNEAERGAWE